VTLQLMSKQSLAGLVGNQSDFRGVHCNSISKHKVFLWLSVTQKADAKSQSNSKQKVGPERDTKRKYQGRIARYISYFDQIAISG
jgi:hypothetical protein